MAAKILSKIVAGPETVFNKMPYFSFKGHFDAGIFLCQKRCS